MAKQLVVTKEGSIIDAQHDRPNKTVINRVTSVTANSFEHRTKKNSDGSPLRARRTGKTQTWKRRPYDFKIPCKYGLYESFYITQDNADQWYIPE